jgi:hypothetical protein
MKLGVQSNRSALSFDHDLGNEQNQIVPGTRANGGGNLLFSLTAIVP